MIAVLVCVVAAVVLAVVMGLLAEVGTRNGDYTHDTTLTVTDYRRYAQAIDAELYNPDSRPVLVGLSIRSPSRFHRPPGGFSVKVPFRTCDPQFFASRQTVFALLLPQQTATWRLFVPGELNALQLDAVIEQADRLRLIRRVLGTSLAKR